MRENFIILHTNCKITKGTYRSCLYDLQRSEYFLIPNSLANLFIEGKELDVKKIGGKLDPENQLILKNYIKFLEEKEMICYVESKELNMFPDLSMEWDYPASISHMIIDSNKHSNHDFKYYFRDLASKINCRYVQIRFFDPIPLSELERTVKIINHTFIKEVDFFVKLERLDEDYITSFVKKNKKIRSLVIHSHTSNKILFEGEYNVSRVMTVQQKIDNESHCGFIHPNYFSINIETFTEAQYHNTCLNRKISIDANGDIKNCPSMSESFGNIKDTTLEEAINKPGFKKYWNINKDKIHVCKDCEFRYICTDCRAYIEDPEDIYSKPLKCGYNPYTGEWEEWSTNPLKQKAIDYYGMQDLVKRG